MTIIEKHKGKMIKKVSNTGVSKEEYNALTNQVAELNGQVNNLNNSLTNKEKEINSGKQLIADAIDNETITNNSTFEAMSEAIISLKEKGSNSPAIKVVAGEYYSAILKENTNLYTAGYNSRGELGVGDSNMRSMFINITDGVIDVYNYGNTTIIIKNDGKLYGIGPCYAYADNKSSSNTPYILNNTINSITEKIKKIIPSTYPYFIDTDGNLWQSSGIIQTDVIDYHFGSGHEEIIKSDGSLWCRGSNSEGLMAIGYNSSTTYSEYISVGSMSSGCKKLYSGYHNIVVMKDDGTLWGIGRNQYGILGIGNTSGKASYVQINMDNIKDVSFGYEHAAILKNDGTLWMTGRNYFGQLGLGDNNNRSSYTQALTDVVSVSCGIQHTLAIKSDGTVWFAGYNCYGEAGMGISGSMNKFTMIPKGYN